MFFMINKAYYFVFVTVFFLLMAAPINSHAQRGDIVVDSCRLVVRYRLTYRPDTTRMVQRTEEMLLLLGENASQFVSANNHFNDSLIYNKAPGTSTNLGEGRGTLVYYRLFKNYPPEKTSFYHNDGTFSYHYQEPLMPYEWTLLPQETDSILGYLVQKATTSYGGRDWEAWFAPQIPINDGPYKFNGLPGLIMKLQDTRRHYVFVLTMMHPPAYPMPLVIRGRRYVQVSRTEFLKLMQNWAQRIISSNRDKGLNHPETERRLMEIQQRNLSNPIELKAN